ncbi:MAG: sensor domain-containing diguanylate cyclase [Acidobacteria bacterium]|nr:MAG: sensor domain-containing diguanylate cyclase [Acidobacteriota bacterium]
MKEIDKAPIQPGTDWFRTLGESVAFAVFAYSKDRFIYTNAAASEISGYSQEELASTNISDLFRPSASVLMPEFDPTLGVYPSIDDPIELPFQTKDGSTRWIAITNAHTVKDGEVIGISTAVNITLRKEAEAIAERRLKLENSLTELSHRFLALGADDLDNAVSFALKTLGSAAGTQCTFIILVDDDQRTITEEFWRHRGKFSHDRTFNRTLKDYGLVRDDLIKHEVLIISDSAPATLNTGCQCSGLEPGNSFAAIPLVSGNHLIGVLGHTWTASPPPIDDDDLRFLRVGGEILSSAIRRVKIERELLRSNDRFELAQLAGRSMAWEWSPTTDEVLMPVAAANLYGFGPEVIPSTGKELNRRVLEEDRPRVAAALRHTLSTGQLYSVEHRYDLPDDNGVVWISARGQAVFDSEGNIEKIIGISADITELKTAEQALKEERERAEVTLESIGDGVIRSDASGRIDYLNPAAEKLTGWPNEEARGRRLDEVYRAMEDGAGKLREDPLTECIRQNRTVTSPEWCSLFHREGLEFAVRDSASPIRNDAGKILGAVLIVKDVTHIRGLEREMAFQASHDTLTGLLNRREFESRVGEALANATFTGRNHALCYLDLDAFKVVNDTCGHSVGDQMLQQLSAVLEATARGTDILARIGGDEFGLLLTDCRMDEAEGRAGAFLQTVRDYRFLWQGRIFEVGVSIGIVPVTKDSPRYNELLSAADAACFVAKERGRNRIHISHPEDVEVAARHHEAQWVERLNRAIEHDDFVLYRQTIVPLKDQNKPKLVELLLRLSEDGEVILPGRFIPAAERYRMMPSLDLWVIRKAFEYIRHDTTSNLDNHQLYAINLSGQSLADRTILDAILTGIDRKDVDPSRLCFEITETAAISHLASAQAFMGVLRERGCSFALDDFGSGLSSFRYLKDLQVDFLKIDGSLVRNVAEDPVHREMVAAIRQIGLAMGLTTIGEWVETEASLEVLKDIGLDYVQGYLFDRPSPI